jgi:prevent-host-death family protein
MPVTTVSSREFNQHVGEAKKAAQTGPVFITDRGEQTHVLLNIKEYKRITVKERTLTEILHYPPLAQIDDDFEFPRIDGPFKSAEFD